MDIHVPEVDDYGGAPVATHDYACPVCRARHAVINLNDGIFQPCWQCQREGWRVANRRRWRRKTR